MTSIAALPVEQIDLDPNVAHPPFAISIALPVDFWLLDTNPATWQRSAEIMLREAFNGGRLTAAERRHALNVLESLVMNCQRGGAALSVIRMGRLSDGTVASAGIHLAWAREKSAASLGRVRDMLPRNGTSTEVPTGVGPAVLHRYRANAQVPGTATIISMAKFQLFVPFPDTHWTAIVSTASAHPELTEALDSLLRAVARSVSLTAPSTDHSVTEPVLGARGQLRPRRIGPAGSPADR